MIPIKDALFKAITILNDHLSGDGIGCEYECGHSRYFFYCSMGKVEFIHDSKTDEALLIHDGHIVQRNLQRNTVVVDQSPSEDFVNMVVQTSERELGHHQILAHSN